MGTVTATPKGLHAAGKRLWLSVVDQFDLDEHETTFPCSTRSTPAVSPRPAPAAVAAPTETSRKHGATINVYPPMTDPVAIAHAVNRRIQFA